MGGIPEGAGDVPTRIRGVKIQETGRVERLVVWESVAVLPIRFEVVVREWMVKADTFHTNAAHL